MLIELRAVAHGRVQGVGFRATAKRLADHLTLMGTVRNLPDGTVEIIAQGDKETLQQFISQLYTHFTVHIEQSFHSPEIFYQNFSILT